MPWTQAPPPDYPSILRDASAEARERAAEGHVADYISPLAEADETAFGMAVRELDGTEHVVGDADTTFPIQSVGKVFALVLGLQRLPDGAMWERCGVEPSGDPFNSLVQLEYERGRPRNPFINAGALVVVDCLLDHLDSPHEDFLGLMRELSGQDVEFDENIATLERDAGHRNRALTHLMANFGNVKHPVEDVLDLYYHVCAVTMTCRSLACAVGFLANDGTDPRTDRHVLDAPRARRVNALMMTCGTYDAAGEFAFEVGMPCKSGVSGGIVGVVPHHFSVAVWSPPLDDSGNSVAGRLALDHLTTATGMSVF